MLVSMSESPAVEFSDTEESRLYDAGRAKILTDVADGTYDPATSPQTIAERTGLGVINVQQLFMGLLTSKEIAWEPSADRDRLPQSRLALTESGEERLAWLLDS